MPVVVLSEMFVPAEAGTPASNVVPQTDSLQAVVAAEEVAVMKSEIYTPLALGKTELAVVSLETTVVL